MTETPEEPTPHRKDFICGVVEGFYGRPWTTEQRKDLFQKLNKWGMDMYVYAPKDDYKHRAYWRELYTVEEAEHLTSLISAAKDQGIIFCYALSPGLDITYSSQKEITTLKRKLEQVSQFGCTCFALLFDDIEPEMSEADKQTFQSFAHAQVSITNEIHQHLGCPRFLLCPTQYCASRAAPCVRGSEYLHTLGAKLSQQIDVMWTGSKVISKTLTPECIEEITQVLRRPPVIWDNLHANDYDQKRIFLGPYCGRSPELIPLLRGVLTNPNCEYNSNMIPIRTLAHWANCSLDAPQQMEAISWDIRLERENESGVCDDDAPLGLDKHVYHHRQALQQAITEWLPEFSIPKMSQGPVIKPQPTITVPPVPIIPIMPSVNTCMSLVTPIVNTATVAQAAIPTVTASQLQALADCCQGPSKVSAIESFNPVPNPVMNSLVSPTKVILNESIPNPIIPMANITLPPEIPVSTLPVPILGLKSLEQEIERDKVEDMAMEKLGDEVLDGFEGLKKEDQDSIVVDDLDSAVEVRNGEMSVGDTPQTLSPPRASLSDLQEPTAPASGDADVVMNDATSENGSMQVEPSNSPLSSDMMVETLDETVDEPVDEQVDDSELTADDLLMLCDAFYLPFEHGSRGLRLLHDFHWLLKHAGEEVSEWRGRLRRFSCACAAYRRCGRRVLRARNRELAQELCPYIHDLCGVLALLRGFLLWCELGKFPPNIAANIQGTFTWFSKGWREAFESGAQEPWVFRGGLPADLRRLLPVECPAPAPRAGLPAGLPCTVRPYRPQDEAKLCEICRLTCRDGSDGSDLFPSDLQDLASDRFLQPYLLLAPDLCMVLEEEDGPEDFDGDGVGDGTGANTNGAPDIIGYACATLDWTDFYRRQQMAWLPEMREKYPKELLERDDLSHFAKECISEFHAEFLPPPPRAVPRAQLARLSCRVRPRAAPPAAPRLAACLLAALTAHGVTGVHAFIRPTEHNLHQMYSKLGFVEVHRADEGVYLTRSF